MKRSRLFVTVLLMLILPWQGLAWAFMPVTSASPACHSSGAAHETMHDNHAVSGHQSMTGDLAAASVDDEDTERPAAAGHHCCQHASSAAVTAAWPGVPPSPAEQLASVRHLVTLHIPDLPQRPPQD
ncbi:MAG: hypothetical protein ACO33A_13335 [Hyphomonas sp.]